MIKSTAALSLSLAVATPGPDTVGVGVADVADDSAIGSVAIEISSFTVVL